MSSCSSGKVLVCPDTQCYRADMAFSDNSRGATFMVASMTAFTLNDAFMKSLSTNLPLFQAIFLRSIGVVLCLLLIAWWCNALWVRLSRGDLRLVAVRTVAEVLAAFFFISAVFNMPLANAIAILQALPLTVTLAGALFLGETVGWRRISAILLGFVGVMLVVQPGTEGFSVYSLYVLAAVCCITVRDLAARQMSGALPTQFVALITAISMCTAFGLGSLAEDWQPVTPQLGALLAGAGLFIIGGYIFSVSAMRSGEIGFVAQFRYSSLLVALIVGVLVFGEFPDVLTLIGATIVVATGLFALWRERRA